MVRIGYRWTTTTTTSMVDSFEFFTMCTCTLSNLPSSDDDAGSSKQWNQQVQNSLSPVLPRHQLHMVLQLWENQRWACNSWNEIRYHWLLLVLVRFLICVRWYNIHFVVLYLWHTGKMSSSPKPISTVSNRYLPPPPRLLGHGTVRFCVLQVVPLDPLESKGQDMVNRAIGRYTSARHYWRFESRNEHRTRPFVTRTDFETHPSHPEVVSLIPRTHSSSCPTFHTLNEGWWRSMKIDATCGAMSARKSAPPQTRRTGTLGSFMPLWRVAL